MSRLLLALSPVLVLACQKDDGLTAFNAEPEAEITSHSDGEEVLEGYVQTFRGSVTDPDNSAEDLTTIWYVGTEEACAAATPASDGSTSCDIVIGADDSKITLEVLDDQNAAGSDVLEITVTPTESPEVVIFTPEEGGLYFSDELILFSGQVSDGEDPAEDLIAWWESSLDGELDLDAEPDTAGAVSDAGYLTEGEHFIELHVEDSTGKTSSAAVIIDVGSPNTPPEAPEVSISPEAPSVGEDDLVCVVDVASTDADGDAIAYDFAWDVDGAAFTGAISTYLTGDTVSSADYTHDQTWTCTVTPNDGIEDGPSASESVTIAVSCDSDGDGYESLDCGGDDCDDTDSGIYPWAGDTFGDGVDSDCDSLDCEAVGDGSAYYALCDGSINWVDARNACLSAGYTDLASVDDASVELVLMGLITNIGSPKCVTGSMGCPWIGYNAYLTGSWSWSDGSGSTYVNWASPEPTGDGSCVHMNRYGSTGWNDTNCTGGGNEYGYICEQ